MTNRPSSVHVSRPETEYRTGTKKRKSYFEHWQHLGHFFQPIWAKLLLPWFAVLPIVLTLLRDAPEKVSFGHSEVFVLNLSLPFKWWLLWQSSLLYLLAFIAYWVWCPAFVRRYKNYAKYIEWGHSPRWMAREVENAVDAVGGPQKPTAAALLKRLVDKGLASPLEEGDKAKVWETVVTAEGTIYRFEHDGQKYRFVGSESSTSASERDREVFWEVFEPFARSRTVRRVIVWVLLALSGTCLFVAVLQSILAVLPHALAPLYHWVAGF